MVDRRLEVTGARWVLARMKILVAEAMVHGMDMAVIGRAEKGISTSTRPTNTKTTVHLIQMQKE